MVCTFIKKSEEFEEKNFNWCSKLNEEKNEKALIMNILWDK